MNSKADFSSGSSRWPASIRIDSPIDFPQLLNRCLGNERLARQVIDLFHDRFGEEVSRLENAVGRADAHEIAAVAHRLKGAAANVAAQAIKEAADGIEQEARDGNLDRVSAWLAKFKQEGQALSNYVAGRSQFRIDSADVRGE